MSKFKSKISTITTRTCAFFASMHVSAERTALTSKGQETPSAGDLAKFQQDFDIITANGGPSDMSVLRVA